MGYIIIKLCWRGYKTKSRFHDIIMVNFPLTMQIIKLKESRLIKYDFLLGYKICIYDSINFSYNTVNRKLL